MLTWRLWQALRYPNEENPLFERVQAQPIAFPGQALLRPLLPVYRALAVLLPAFVVVVAPAALVLASNILGALIAFNIMSTINAEREQRTYDLLALTPMGLGRANWQIASACTQRLRAIDRLAQVRTLAVITLIVLMFYLLRYNIFTSLGLLILYLALNLDGIQSLIVGCLSGMLAQAFSEHSAPFAALTIFAAVQVIAVYLPVTAVAILLFDDASPSRELFLNSDGLIALIVLGLLYGLREAIIRLMWRELERRLL